MIKLLSSLILAYLVGSITWSIILAKLFHLPDPRTTGSGNPGATNMMRTSGKRMGIVVLLGDLLKGFVVILIAKYWGLHGFGLALVGLAAIIGHLFPLYFQFQGGKGVATSLGVFLGLSSMVGLLLIILWVLFVVCFRYASLASLIIIILAPLVMLFSGHGSYFFPLLFISALVIWKHLDNIHRLYQRTENKIKF